VETGNLSLHQPYPASYSMGTMGYFPGDKATRSWSWPLTSIQCRCQSVVI